MNLFELTKGRLELQHRLESLDLDAETIQDTLEGESTELTAKIEDYGFVLRNRDGLGDLMKAEIDRMQSRLTAHTKRTDAIKKWLQENMIACGMTKIECPAFTVSLKTNPPKVVIDDESAIPKEYWKTPEPKPPVATPDKKAIMAALKGGKEVAGCHSQQDKRILIG